ncbi:MAG TPA: DNA polymerase III subunit gamma/tau [Thiolapillus brandeum]|uniref:DNA polymerase III subunit gamma/tau n=1 Tax=Thiolapillus brandeum TaxID=1076588 RepID=A0A831RUZ3_9GAMM|nr:DNA polymerase III subunit gamma/tau [Thiolapillus brandeum]
MSYQVLARKWRPKTFEEMVGQEHVVRALSNALDNDRLHHAYLFTGTRGVGKTTLARILAKSLNCEKGVSSTPCGECSICREVDEGRFADLLEVDAASRTKVDQTLELLENVPFAPIRGRYKVYLIDEVHMFSNSSFNALLKTLEEPPPHVKFLLATTDPQKVPVTVLSRCLQMNLKRLPLEQIRGQFEHVLKAEGVDADASALDLLARVADGSMRDGLSILDQAIAFGGGQVREEEVKAMLGVVAQDQLPQLLRSVIDEDAAAVLEQIATAAQQSPDFAALLKDLLLLLHRIALYQASPEAADPSWGDLSPVKDLAAGMGPEDVQLFYEIALRGQRDLYLAPDPRSGFEMILLRMLAFRPAAGEPEPARVPVSRTQPRAASAGPRPAPVQNTPPSGVKSAVAAGQDEQPRQVAEPRPQGKETPDLTDWHQVLPRLGLGGISSQLAAHCTVKSWQDDLLLLTLNPTGGALAGAMPRQKLQEALENYLGRSIQMKIEVAETVEETPAQVAERRLQEKQSAAVNAMREDPVVKTLEEDFDGELLIDSIKLNDQ